jgi:hypothetical protein
MQKKRWVAEELYIRDKTGIQLLDDYALSKLLVLNDKEPFKMEGEVPNYNILQNLDY